MGLAASQARFLAITSRKMNCEFQSMQIAQQKLSVTRDMQKASQEYQNALSATKLVWDCDTVDNDVYDLSYNVMMQPSMINEYDPYLITDTQGKILLDEKTWNALRAAQLIDENGDYAGETYSEAGRNEFLEALGAAGIAEASTVKSIIDLGENGYTQSGVGGEIFDKTLACIMNTSAFLNYMKSATYDENIYETVPKVDDPNSTEKKLVHKKGDSIYEMKLLDILCDKGEDDKFVKNTDGTYKTTINIGDTEKTISYRNVLPDSLKENQWVITKGESKVSTSALEELTLADLLTGKYTIAFRGDNNDQDDMIVALSTKILNAISRSLGFDPTMAGDNRFPSTGLGVTDQANSALEEAYNMTSILIGKSAIKGAGYGKLSDMVKQAQDMNVIDEHNDIHSYTLSISNMAKSFLTYFVIALEGYDCGLAVDKNSAKNSNYVVDYPSYNFQLRNDTGMTERGELNADFYNQLYNQLCMNGACSDKTKREMVTDNSYLHNALKNGQLFVSTLNTDGYFYQGHYTNSEHIAEVTDEAAVAQAEVQYNITKSKLNYKEETLELQMKNLDTEISALSTEYETVKGLISKGVEKVFTMFSS